MTHPCKDFSQRYDELVLASAGETRTFSVSNGPLVQDVLASACAALAATGGGGDDFDVDDGANTAAALRQVGRPSSLAAAAAASACTPFTVPPDAVGAFEAVAELFSHKRIDDEMNSLVKVKASGACRPVRTSPTVAPILVSLCMTHGFLEFLRVFATPPAALRVWRRARSR